MPQNEVRVEFWKPMLMRGAACHEEGETQRRNWAVSLSSVLPLSATHSQPLKRETCTASLQVVALWHLCQWMRMEPCGNRAAAEPVQSSLPTPALFVNKGARGGNGDMYRPSRFHFQGCLLKVQVEFSVRALEAGGFRCSLTSASPNRDSTLPGPGPTVEASFPPSAP